MAPVFIISWLEDGTQFVFELESQNILMLRCGSGFVIAFEPYERSRTKLMLKSKRGLFIPFLNFY